MQPKYAEEVKAIQKREEKLMRKIGRDLKYDDEGFDMWTLSMDNNKFKQHVKEG